MNADSRPILIYKGAFYRGAGIAGRDSHRCTGVRGRQSNLQAIIDACESGAIDGDMAFVGRTTRPPAVFNGPRGTGIPTFVVDYTDIIATLQAKTLRRFQPCRTISASEQSPPNSRLFGPGNAMPGESRPF